MSSFATVDELANALGLPIPDQRRDGAEQAIKLASALIQNEARQLFDLVEDETIEIVPKDIHEFWLPQRPVTDVSAVLIADVALFGYEWFRTGLVRWPGNLLMPMAPAGWMGAKITVTYTHGAAEPPEAIKAVCLSSAIRAFVNPAGASQVQAGNHQINYGAAALSRDERIVCRGYRVKAAMV